MHSLTDWKKIFFFFLSQGNNSFFKAGKEEKKNSIKISGSNEVMSKLYPHFSFHMNNSKNARHENN